MQKKPVLVYTDDGRDVDDIEAIAYLTGHPNIDIVGIVTTHMIPDRRATIARALMNSFGIQDVPIGVGSVFPIGKEDEDLVKYLREHTVDNMSYEGMGLVECFPNGIDLIHDTIDKYGPDLSIAVLAPATDLAKAIQADSNHFAKVGGLYIQGQAKVEDSRLVPDTAAYNLKEDMEATEFVFGMQDWVPMTFVGKWAAYQIPLTKDDFAEFADSNHPAGKYLDVHAHKGLECFVKRAPDIFKKVFGVPEEMDAYEGFEQLENLSNPYDAVTVMALTEPQLFSGQSVGQHTLIGMTKEDPGIKDTAILKNELMNKILYALEAYNVNME